MKNQSTNPPSRPGPAFWRRPTVDRRAFFRHAGAAVAGSFFLPGNAWETVAGAQTRAGRARNVIFVMMAGGPSHVDTFDLKEGAWTVPAMEPTTYGPLRWPRGLFPKMAERIGSIAVVRSAMNYALVHGVMQNWIQIGRNPLSGLNKIAPHIGSVVSREVGSPDLIMPAFVSLNSGGGPNQGYLEPRHAPFYVTPSGGGLGNTVSSLGPAAFDRRYGLLLELDAETRAMAEIGPAVKEFEQYNLTARMMMYNSSIDKVFTFDATERARYGNSSFGNACLAARNLLRGDIGARFIQITVGGWDLHTSIYLGSGLNPSNAASTGRTFDAGLGTLLADLQSDGLLANTLVFAMGEFGRTVGPLNSGGGRDHYFNQAILFAGAGIKGPKAIGVTDEVGRSIVDTGWGGNRAVYPEDVEATIYAALGIDWNKVYRDDPFGRGFNLVPDNQGLEYRPVQELWA